MVWSILLRVLGLIHLSAKIIFQADSFGKVPKLRLGILARKKRAKTFGMEFHAKIPRRNFKPKFRQFCLNWLLYWNIGQNFRREKFFVGWNFRYWVKISTILSDEFLSGNVFPILPTFYFDRILTYAGLYTSTFEQIPQPQLTISICVYYDDNTKLMLPHALSLHICFFILLFMLCTMLLMPTNKRQVPKSKIISVIAFQTISSQTKLSDLIK